MGRKKTGAYLLICSILGFFIFSACSTPPPDQPLSVASSTNTPVTGTPTLISSQGTQISPISVINNQSNLSAYPGGYMDLTISTSPNALCTFLISYGMATPSKETGILPQTTDSQGIASWHWRVESRAHTGPWPLSISATLANGARTSLQINITVLPAPITVVDNKSTLMGSPKQALILTIMTAPSIDCILTLNYGAGSGLPVKLLKSRSDANGIAIWTWNIAEMATTGVFPLAIQATLADGETSTSQVNMTII